MQYGKYFLKSYCSWTGCDLNPLHIDIGGGMQSNLGMQTFIELCVFLWELAVCLGHVAKLLWNELPESLNPTDVCVSCMNSMPVPTKVLSYTVQPAW